MSERERPLTPDLMALLDAERHAPEPSSRTHERVRARVLASLGLVAAPPPVPPAVTPPSAPVAPLAGWGLRALVLAGSTFVVGAMGGIGSYLMMGHRPAPRVVLDAPGRETIAVPPSVVAGVRELPPVVETAPAAAPPSRHVAASAPAGSLADEQALLEPARAALAAQDGAAALAAVGRHAHAFPRGQLTEERESLRVRALAAAGRPDAARARAAAFRRRYPHSIFLPVVDSALTALP